MKWETLSEWTFVYKIKEKFLLGYTEFDTPIGSTGGDCQICSWGSVEKSRLDVYIWTSPAYTWSL